MQKPNDFDTAKGFTEFEPLEKGGHICKIMNIEETKSKTNKDMIVIYLDTDKSDKQPNYYSDLYKNDNRNPKKWSNNAICRQLVLDADGFTNRGFKSFIDCVEESNPGFKVTWGEKFCDCLKGKLVGGIFGREQYEYNGKYNFAVKFQNFRTVEMIKKGVEPPADKLLSTSKDDEMMRVVDDGDLPFN